MSEHFTSPLLWLALLAAGLSAVIVLWYLIARPTLDAMTKLLLLLGIAALPMLVAFSTVAVGSERTTTRQFCGSCHPMQDHVDDGGDALSETLAAVHGRNDLFGRHSCYTCHSDQGMFGLITTKINGMHHVVAEYFEAPRPLALYKPFPNASCTRCHSMTTPKWRKSSDHLGAFEELRSNAISCASEGCHGPAHPAPKGATP